jgi:hypothetical protein
VSAPAPLSDLFRGIPGGAWPCRAWAIGSGRVVAVLFDVAGSYWSLRGDGFGGNPGRVSEPEAVRWAHKRVLASYAWARQLSGDAMRSALEGGEA